MAWSYNKSWIQTKVRQLSIIWLNLLIIGMYTSLLLYVTIYNFGLMIFFNDRNNTGAVPFPITHMAKR
jgi:hypothetical protein